MSNVPWRKSGAKYSNNEIYFDIIEELDSIIDSNGQSVMLEVHGNIEVTATKIQLHSSRNPSGECEAHRDARSDAVLQ